MAREACLPLIPAEVREVYRTFIKETFTDYQAKGTLTGIIVRDFDLANELWTRAELPLDS